MDSNGISKQEINLLRYYILFQLSANVLSFIWNLRVSTFAGNQFNIIGIVPIIILLIIFVALTFMKNDNTFDKKHLFITIFIITIITMFSRFFTPVFSVRRMYLLPGTVNYGFDQIFFLIFPILFLAWQFSRKTVLMFCALITVSDILVTWFSVSGDPLTIQILLGIIVLRGFVLGVIGVFVNQMSQVQKLQQIELKKANIRLRKYALSTEQLAQTRERNRLARELHDTLAHTLSSVAVQLEAVKVLFETNPVEAKKVLDKSLENTRNGLNETRRALKDLRTSEVENFGLSQSLRNLLVSGAERSGFDYDENLTDNLNLLPAEISHFIYRTIQEAVENTVKHAHAKHVDLDVNVVDDIFYLRYKDDGLGFSLDELDDAKHYGLQGMRERIELLGGNYDIQSAPGQGTTITIKTELIND
ncbi:MAG TPA: hypothetical protein DCK95_08035 [Anaerolineaceae bacterium]|nr:hypothetical protein [Anaerolineaceae bacterium]